ncbi:MAG: metal ABC transporter substrate-binding protein [Ignavibacteria bacterium]|nr:metal ABC transporter substrate-binding protein [Ignavibacteria bacterium]
MKKAFLLVLFLFGCATKEDNQNKNYIFTSNYPLKLIIQEIIGDSSRVISLVPPSASEHTFQPKFSDIQKLEKAKIFFYVSDLLDHWVTNTIPNKVEVIKFISKDRLIHYLEGSDVDPHFWTDPSIIESIVDSIARKLIAIFPEKAAEIQKNSNNFRSKLIRLDKQVREITRPIEGKYVFLFHPSFLYFLKRYNLNYGGSIEETAGMDPTPKHIQEIAKKIKEFELQAIFTEPQLNPEPAKVIAKETGVKLFELDPLGFQNVNSYEELILKNANTLLNALK